MSDERAAEFTSAAEVAAMIIAAAQVVKTGAPIAVEAIRQRGETDRARIATNSRLEDGS